MHLVNAACRWESTPHLSVLDCAPSNIHPHQCWETRVKDLGLNVDVGDVVNEERGLRQERLDVRGANSGIEAEKFLIFSGRGWEKGGRRKGEGGKGGRRGRGEGEGEGEEEEEGEGKGKGGRTFSAVGVEGIGRLGAARPRAPTSPRTMHAWRRRGARKFDEKVVVNWEQDKTQRESRRVGVVDEVAERRGARGVLLQDPLVEARGSWQRDEERGRTPLQQSISRRRNASPTACRLHTCEKGAEMY